jgi:hypothetical protein
MNRSIIAILFPIALLLGWVASLQVHRTGGTHIRVAIEGYDPRDLLAGHFIRFALSLGNVNPCVDGSDSNRCVCYAPEKGTLYHKAFWGGRCLDLPTPCPVYIRGACSGRRFMTGKERYSIPEQLIPALPQTRIPEDSSVVLAVDGNGGVLVTEMFAGNETIEGYMQRQLIKMQAQPNVPG